MERTAISSSGMTFLEKVVFPTVWIGTFVVATGFMLYQNRPEALQFLALTIIGAGILLPLAIKLKYVGMDDGYIYLTGLRRTAKIPLADVASIRQIPLLNIRLTRLNFCRTTIFGRSVLFIPKRKISGSSNDNAVELLRDRVVRNQAAIPER